MCINRNLIVGQLDSLFHERVFQFLSTIVMFITHEVHITLVNYAILQACLPKNLSSMFITEARK